MPPNKNKTENTNNRKLPQEFRVGKHMGTLHNLRYSIAGSNNDKGTPVSEPIRDVKSSGQLRSRELEN